MATILIQRPLDPKNVQCWIARVTDGEGDGWVIEDGLVKSEPAELQEA